MPKFKIFYSWQSDLPGSVTRNFIRDCIDDAIAFAEESEAIEAERDEATLNTTGSPNIVTTLFSKIDEADLFVADLSLCFTGDVNNQKHAPNPNVLLELGYAVKTLDWDRVICLCNADFGSEYPFDVAHNRVTTFCLEGKDKKTEQRRIAKILLSNIQSLRGQAPRAKTGLATHVIGAYDFEKKKVESLLVPLNIEHRESFICHNNALQNEARRLIKDIQAINTRMRKRKAAEEKLKVELPEREVMAPFSQLNLQKTAIHALAESYKASETAVVWKDIKDDKERIERWLNLEVEDDFFDLGDLKKAVQLFNHGSTLNGTDDEKEKYDKLQKLSYALLQLEVRTRYLETYDGICFIPLAIQNISYTQDMDIRVVVNVESGEIIEPDEHLIIEDYDGLQGLLCSDDDDPGIIPELFTLPEDGVVHTEETPWYPAQNMPKMPVLNGYGFSEPAKTEEDYKEEMSEYIASTGGRGYYEFDVQNLRPNECRWFSTGMLIRPVDGEIRISYRIHSSHSNGNLFGILELAKGSTI